MPPVVAIEAPIYAAMVQAAAPEKLREWLARSRKFRRRLTITDRQDQRAGPREHFTMVVECSWGPVVIAPWRPK